MSDKPGRTQRRLPNKAMKLPVAFGARSLSPGRWAMEYTSSRRHARRNAAETHVPAIGNGQATHLSRGRTCGISAEPQLEGALPQARCVARCSKSVPVISPGGGRAPLQHPAQVLIGVACGYDDCWHILSERPRA